MEEDVGSTRGLARAVASELVGEENVTVYGGAFSARHYRSRTRYDETIDYWMNDRVFPMGLVKLVSEVKQAPARGAFRIELGARGKGWRPMITKPARPWDAETLNREMPAPMRVPAAQ